MDSNKKSSVGACKSYYMNFDSFKIVDSGLPWGLCGNLLSKKCWISNSSPPSPSIFEQNQDTTSFLFGFGWKIIFAGYRFGLIFGVIIGNIVAKKKLDWLMKTFGMKQQAHRSMRRQLRNWQIFFFSFLSWWKNKLAPCEDIIIFII